MTRDFCTAGFAVCPNCGKEAFEGELEDYELDEFSQMFCSQCRKKFMIKCEDIKLYTTCSMETHYERNKEICLASGQVGL